MDSEKKVSVSEFRDLVERRTYHRLQRDVLVRCRFTGIDAAAVQATALDIGRGGIRLRISSQLPQGSVLEVAFHDPEHELAVVLSGVVVWTEHEADADCYQTGIQFPDVTPDDLQNLLALVGADESGLAEEQRRFVRLNRHLVVGLQGGKLLRRKVMAAVLDISFGGMAVESEKPLREQETYDTEIFLPTEARPVTMTTRVLESRDGGDGHWRSRLKFEQIEPVEVRRIGQFLSEELMSQRQ